MPQITYRATNFPASYGAILQGSHVLTFAWPELIWAAISVGRKELMHLTRYGPFSAFEIVYRAAIVFANLRETDSGDLTRSAAYDGLDPSEKGAVSYFMGLTVAKLLADRLLDVPWLMHLDVYRAELAAALDGNLKPDLVGRNGAGEWVAMESKGRSRGEDARALTRAKEQVESLSTVGGEEVALRVAALAHFEDDVLQCTLDDPKRPREKHRINLPLNRERFFEGYYRPFREWLQTAPNARIQIVQEQRFVVADLSDVDLQVGLEDLVLRGKTVSVQRQRPPIGDSLEHSSRQFVGPDGVLVSAGTLWSVENMQREPQERDRPPELSAGSRE